MLAVRFATLPRGSAADTALLLLAHLSQLANLPLSRTATARSDTNKEVERVRIHGT